ncbi:MAG: hypothetical protein KAU21_15210, partial [Gammaproteobacteria bacterium]|nr:hypothetical protein [Gammaproteobacteria bacterium]
MLKIIIILILITVNALPAYADMSNSDPKETITVILKHDPFPHEKSSTRWTLDVDMDKLLTDKDEDITIPEYLISLIAIIGKYILWIVLMILLFVLYLNRKLFHFENLTFSRKNKQLPDDPVVSKRKNTQTDDVLDDVKQYLQSNEYRKAVALLYSGLITYLINNNFNISDSLTESEILLEKNNLKNKVLNELVEKVINLRIIIAFQHLEP